MFPTQIPQTDSDELLRCGDKSQLLAEEQKGHDENVKTDEALAHEVDHALWKDSAFRATDYNNIDMRVSGAIVYLNGHVSSLTNLRLAEKSLQTIPGLLGVNNHLIPDDRLLAEVSTALGQLESAYDCKFFTGVSHGVVLLSGNVSSINIKLLAEKCAANNPNVRGVINSVYVTGSDLDLPEEPFLQPVIGEEIFFLDGISGTVQQVIINPDNRRVIAMTLRGRFENQRQELKALNDGEARSAERLIVITMNSVRYLTKVSGFLYIKSNEKNRYMDFDPAQFFVPKKDWKAPYPYCPDDVLFLIEQQDMNDRILRQLPGTPILVGLEAQLLREQLPANDSLGG
jgi:osmotically-inducible protein OsmY